MSERHSGKWVSRSLRWKGNMHQIGLQFKLNCIDKGVWDFRWVQETFSAMLKSTMNISAANIMNYGNLCP